MSAQSLFRLTAAAAVLGAVLFILGVLLVDPPSISGRLEAAAAPQLLLVAFGVLFLVAVVGLYLRQHREVGMLGLLGAAMSFIGTVLMTSNNYVFAFVVPVLAERVPEFLEPGGGWAQILPVNIGVRIGFSAGLLLFGIATFRAAILPRWAAVMFSIGGLVVHAFLFLPWPIDLVVASVLPVGLVGLAWGLWSSVAESGARAATEGGRVAAP